jgi:hypothetical protein
MNFLLRLLGGILIGTGVAFSLVALPGGWLGQGGVSGLDAVITLVNEWDREDRLAHRNVVLLNRLDSKSAIARQVIDGRLTLLEAAAYFHRLNQCSECPNTFLSLLEGECEGEWTCRQVIAWVRAEAAYHTPSQARAVVRNLQVQLQYHLDRYGEVDLEE